MQTQTITFFATVSNAATSRASKRRTQVHRLRSRHRATGATGRTGIASLIYASLTHDEVKMDGVTVRIYCQEKTLADCFKYHNKIGINICVEALKFYRERGRMRMDLIEQYAKMCRVQKVMLPYLEATL